MIKFCPVFTNFSYISILRGLLYFRARSDHLIIFHLFIYLLLFIYYYLFFKKIKNKIYIYNIYKIYISLL